MFDPSAAILAATTMKVSRRAKQLAEIRSSLDLPEHLSFYLVTLANVASCISGFVIGNRIHRAVRENEPEAIRRNVEAFAAFEKRSLGLYLTGFSVSMATAGDTWKDYMDRCYNPEKDDFPCLRTIFSGILLPAAVFWVAFFVPRLYVVLQRLLLDPTRKDFKMTWLLHIAIVGCMAGQPAIPAMAERWMNPMMTTFTYFLVTGLAMVCLGIFGYKISTRREEAVIEWLCRRAGMSEAGLKED